MSTTEPQVVEKKPESTLDSSVKGLLKTISSIGNHGKMGSVDFLKSSKPYWNLCCDKFHAAYIKARNPEGFRDMFYNFYDKHNEKFTEDVVSDGEINDEWLKSKEVLPLPGASAGAKKKKSADEFGFSLKSISCRGEIIYFDETNEKIRNVSIPITEAYLAACKIYVDGAKSGEYSPLPAQLLCYLYQIMYHVCDTADQETMQKNVDSLREIVESLTSEDGASGEGATLEPIKGMMKTLANKFGVSGDASKFLEGDGIQKAISGIFSEDVTSKMKNMWSTFQDKVKIDDSKDIGALISNIGEAIKDPSLQNSLQEGISTIASAVGMGPSFELSAAEKEKVAPSSESAAPGNQE